MMMKLLWANLLFLGTAATTNAQESAPPLRTADAMTADMTNLVDRLEENALLALLGFIVLMGVGWLIYLCKACSRLPRTRSGPWLGALVGMACLVGTLGSGCSLEQQIKAAQIRAAQVAEQGACPVKHPLPNGPDNYYAHHYAPNYTVSGPSVQICKHCGRRFMTAHK